MKVSVILPTYNEKDNILKLIENILAMLDKIDSEIIVVDDNSPDGTAKLVKNLAEKQENINIIVREKERGLATALLAGIQKSTGDTIVTMDTDFSHDPASILQLSLNAKDNDIVIGSRYIEGGAMLGPKYRFFGSYLMNVFLKFLLGIETKDNTGGFLAIKKNVLEGIELSNIFYGYGDYCIRLIYFAKLMNLKVVEIPVTYKFRVSGTSKTNFLRHALDYGMSVIRLKAHGLADIEKSLSIKNKKK